MNDYLYASLIVSADQREAAQALLSPNYFNFPLSADGSPPATHYVSAGPFDDQELNLALNQTEIQFWVHFGRQPDYNGMLPVVDKS